MLEFYIAFTMNLLLFAAIMGIIYWAFIGVRKRTDKAFMDFAARHGFVYERDNTKGYSGILNGKVSNKAFGIDTQSKKAGSVFYLTHVEGHGRSRRVYERTVASAALKGTKAHIFINAKLNDIQEQSGLAANQSYSAEGNFGKYFDIYFPNGHQATALSIFAPDAMSVVMADYGYHDIEIVDDVLYLYDYSHIKKADELEQLYQLASRLAGTVDNNSPRKLALASTSAETSGGVARLQKQGLGLIGKIIVVMFVVLIFAMRISFGLGGRIAAFSSILTLCLAVILVIIVVIRLLHNGKQRYNYERERQPHKQKTPPDPTVKF